MFDDCLLCSSHSENEDHGIQSHHFMANRWETMETVTDFIFLGFKITAEGDCSREIKTLNSWKENYDKPRQNIKKQRYHLLTKVCIVKTMFLSGSHIQM